MGLIDLGAKGVQGALNLVRKSTPSEKAFENIMVRGPRGEYYTFPKEAGIEQRKGWPKIKEAVFGGLVEPSLTNPATIKASQLEKAQSAARLASTVSELGLPRFNPQFDALALKMGQSGRKADALAALDGPQTIKEPGAMYLYDLAANVDAPGSGNELLKAILKGPLFPDADKVVFTPLPKARDFYEKKFGAEFMSPLDALSDDAISRILKSTGMQHNAEDLGVGILRRAEGGLVKMAGGGRPAEFDHGLHQKEFNRSKEAAKQGAIDFATNVLPFALPGAGPVGRAVLGATLALDSGDVMAGPTRIGKNLILNGERILRKLTGEDVGGITSTPVNSRKLFGVGDVTPTPEEMKYIEAFVKGSGGKLDRYDEATDKLIPGNYASGGRVKDPLPETPRSGYNWDILSEE